MTRSAADRRERLSRWRWQRSADRLVRLLIQARCFVILDLGVTFAVLVVFVASTVREVARHRFRFGVAEIFAGVLLLMRGGVDFIRRSLTHHPRMLLLLLLLVVS